MNDAKEGLRALVQARVDAVARRDADALAAMQADDVLLFNVLPPLSVRGSADVATQTRAWFDAYAEGPGYTVHELQVDASGDLGYCTFVYHVTGTLRTGDEVSMQVRATLVCRRTGDSWVVVHDHESVPWTAQD